MKEEILDMKFRLVEDYLVEVSQRDLDRVAKNLQKQLPDGYIAVGNKDHACVDIRTIDGKIVGQAYPDKQPVEKDYTTLVRLNSIDEIQDGDILYAKRVKTGMRSKTQGIRMIKTVSGVDTSFNDFVNSLD